MYRGNISSCFPARRTRAETTAEDDESHFSIIKLLEKVQDDQRETAQLVQDRMRRHQEQIEGIRKILIEQQQTKLKKKSAQLKQLRRSHGRVSIATSEVGNESPLPLSRPSLHDTLPSNEPVDKNGASNSCEWSLCWGDTHRLLTSRVSCSTRAITASYNRQASATTISSFYPPCS